jgi:hypothetical protein
LSPASHVWATVKETVPAVRETASSVSTIREEHVRPTARPRMPSVRSSQPLGADEGPADGTRLGVLVGPADGLPEGAADGLVDGSGVDAPRAILGGSTLVGAPVEPPA